MVIHTPNKLHFGSRILTKIIQAVEADGKTIDEFRSDAEHMYWTKESI